jgi:hypothetical protein
LREIKKLENKEINSLYYRVMNQYRDRKVVREKYLHQQGKKIIDSFEFYINAQLNNRLSQIQEIMKKKQIRKHNNICKIV